MKKIIPLILVLLCLFGCSAELYTPVIASEDSLSAVYKTGDFSYTCKIVRSNDFVSITPTSSSAEGMTIKCDGKEVTFTKGDMTKTFDKNELDKTNPSIILFEVFASLESANVKLIDDEYTYSGKTSVGNYILTQDKNNYFKSIKIPDANIEISFQN